MSKAIFRQAGRAIADFNMIKNGDKVLLGLSGGKDSMSLLHILARYILARFRRHAPVAGLIGLYSPSRKTLQQP